MEIIRHVVTLVYSEIPINGRNEISILIDILTGLILLLALIFELICQSLRGQECGTESQAEKIKRLWRDSSACYHLYINPAGPTCPRPEQLKWKRVDENVFVIELLL